MRLNSYQRKRLRTLVSALLVVIITLVLFEIALRVIDPWGLRYFDDVTKMGKEMFVVDPLRGYGLKDGTHIFSHWQATIKDGQRVTPDTNSEAKCSIAFLGDSVTFGASVNDDQTWVNALAGELPDVKVVNYGVPRYNSTNVLNTRLAFPDHPAYIYTIFNNDSEPAYDPSIDDPLVTGLNQPWIVHYMQLALRRNAPPAPIDSTRFFSELDALMAAGRVYLVAFSDDVLTDLVIERGYTVFTVAYPPHPTSVADFHLNPQGNAELATSLSAFVHDIVGKTC